jgi:hypothetical protein
MTERRCARRQTGTGASRAISSGHGHEGPSLGGSETWMNPRAWARWSIRCHRKGHRPGTREEKRERATWARSFCCQSDRRNRCGHPAPGLLRGPLLPPRHAGVTKRAVDGGCDSARVRGGLSASGVCEAMGCSGTRWAGGWRRSAGVRTRFESHPAEHKASAPDGDSETRTGARVRAWRTTGRGRRRGIRARSTALPLRSWQLAPTWTLVRWSAERLMPRSCLGGRL